MLFSSLTFLLLFLPITVGVYYAFKTNKIRNIVLLIFSLIFYGWGEPRLILLMMVLLIINYLLVLIMDAEDGQKRKIWLWTIVLINLGTLFYYKYFNFALSNFNRLFGTELVSNVVLPIGISFYLFQILSYAIDVYRKEVKAQKNFILLSTYISLFPQLIAGPIVRYQTIENQLKERKENWKLFNSGISRFIVGLGKKVIISNNVAIIANMVFSETPINQLNFFLAWAGAIAFTLQIYFDFSGYSDMAIGLGRMFGFEFLENFNYPYISKSITEFWRRWHMSLGTWFRDYVYIPLGGNRCSKGRHIFNMLVVWGLTGLWHGASWNFVFWGLYFAVLLIAEKYIINKFADRVPNFIRWLFTILLVIFGWVIFNSTSMAQIIAMFKNMFDFKTMMSLNEIKNMRIIYLWPYFTFGFIFSFPVKEYVSRIVNKFKFKNIIVDLILIAILYWSIVLLINNSYNPFIYFRF